MGKSRNTNIVLIGFMGSGKSTIGRRLSKEMNYSFMDTDEQIELDEGKEIKDIFAQQGEAHFRFLEAELLQRLSSTYSKGVLSTGGGMPMREENQSLLQELGFVVYLKTSVETSLQRLQKDTTRPLIQGDNLKEKIMSLQTKRDPIYRKVAHCIVETDDKSPKNIASEILKEYSMYRDNL